MTNASPIVRPRATRLQFSLRVLLVAFTAFAIGFPIWYRWPFKEEELLPSPFSGVGSAEWKRVATWQRQWGGGKLKHGQERQLLNGETVGITNYRHGRKHGSYAAYTISTIPAANSLSLRVSDQPTTTGQYADDLKQGVWIDNDISSSKRTSTWERGRLEGRSLFEFPGGRKLELIFAAGRLTHMNGHPAQNRLFDLVQSGRLDPRISDELRKYTSIDVVQMPLKDVLDFLEDLHGVPIVLDSRQVLNADVPITGEYKGIDLCSALTLLTAPNDLGCDFRYSCIWITAAEDVKDWHDPTGVAEIKPPAQSALGRAWDEPVKLEVAEAPLTDVLDYLAQRLVIEIDMTLIQPTTEPSHTYPVVHSSDRLPFRHVLGQVLYKTGCRCRLESDTLVILPPEE